MAKLSNQNLQASRRAAEGLIGLATVGTSAALVEVDTETLLLQLKDSAYSRRDGTNF